MGLVDDMDPPLGGQCRDSRADVRRRAGAVVVMLMLRRAARGLFTVAMTGCLTVALGSGLILLWMPCPSPEKR